MSKTFRANCETLYCWLEKLCGNVLEEDKICVPVSGGLDSRVLAGILARHRRIDLIFTIYYQDENNFEYAMEIAERLKPKRFLPVFFDSENIANDKHVISSLPNPEHNFLSGNYTAIRKLNDVIDLSKYTVLVPYDLDIWTGIGVNLLTLHKYVEIDLKQFIKSHEVNRPQLQVWEQFFKKAINPFDDKDFINWCLSLPVSHRFNQRLYRKMISEYLPKLADIPREGTHVAPNANELRYFYARLSRLWNRAGLVQ